MNITQCKIICGGVAKWNEWRESHPRAKIDLCGAKLQGADLYGADLRRAKLQGAVLREASLRQANLSGAKLQGANLRWVNLRWVNLSGANLRGVDLQGAKYDVRQMVCGPHWYEVSDELCLELMRFDCAALGASLGDMDKAILLFDTWKERGLCPFAHTPTTRPCLFHESRDLWSPGKPKSLKKLWAMIVKEKEIKV